MTGGTRDSADDLRAVTIGGTVGRDNLGFVLPHEHLTIHTSDLRVSEGEYPQDAKLSPENLSQVRRWPRSLVDNAIMDDDTAVVRDLRRYVRAATGYYLSYGHRGRVADRSAGELADEFVGELTEGVAGVRCGVIGEIGMSAEPEPASGSGTHGAFCAGKNQTTDLLGVISQRQGATMGITILRNASVLDPEAGELTEGQSVVIEGGRIADVGPGLSGPDDAVILDVGGKTVMPGLIDAHTHPAIVDEDIFDMAEWPPTYVAARAGKALEGMLARGFTTIRDVGAGEVGLARAVEEGYFTGPRIRYGGKQLSQTGGAGDWRAPSRRVYDDNYYTPAIGVICDGVPEVRRAVREEVRRGAHHIKVYLSGAVDSASDRVDSTQFSLEELRAIVEEAEAANIYVTGHAYTSRAINRGLECGVRCIEHGNLMDASSIPVFQKYDAFYVPTIVTYHCLRRKADRLPKDIAEKNEQVIVGAMNALSMAHEAGLPIVYGTDLFADTHEHQLEEFIIRSEVQSPADLIRGATSTAARLLQMEGQVGVVASGAFADLLVVDGNPLEDIRVLTTPDRTLRLIMKEGQIYKNEL
jgi:imidazolonepropionase-like amidohydrolase